MIQSYPGYILCATYLNSSFGRSFFLLLIFIGLQFPSILCLVLNSHILSSIILLSFHSFNYFQETISFETFTFRFFPLFTKLIYTSYLQFWILISHVQCSSFQSFISNSHIAIDSDITVYIHIFTLIHSSLASCIFKFVHFPFTSFI